MKKIEIRKLLISTTTYILILVFILLILDIGVYYAHPGMTLSLIMQLNDHLLFDVYLVGLPFLAGCLEVVLKN